MKVIQRRVLIDRGDFSASREWELVEKEILKGIRSVVWPPGSSAFTVLDQSGKKRGEGSGVTRIKEDFIASLVSDGWKGESSIITEALRGTGPFDAARILPGAKCDVKRTVGKNGRVSHRLNARDNRLFVVEWETGNISSSHRAVNKMALGLRGGAISGGALILPTRNLYRFLTDRVGNYPELEPYFPLWEALSIKRGRLEVFAVEYDAVSKTVPRIPKGTDGRALQ